MQKSREATLDRMVANAPSTFTPAQLRVLLRAIVNLAPHTFVDDLADDLAGAKENEQLTAEEDLLSTIESLTDDKLNGFCSHLALAGRRGIPRKRVRFPRRSGECIYATAANREGEAEESEEGNSYQCRFQACPEGVSEESQIVEKKIAA